MTQCGTTQCGTTLRVVNPPTVLGKESSNRSRPMAESRQVPQEEPLISANER